MAKIQILILLLMMITNSFTYGKEYTHPTKLYNTALESYNNKDLGQAMYYVKQALLLNPARSEYRALFYQIRKDIGLPQIYSTDTLGGQVLSQVFGFIPPHINALLGGILFIFGSFLVSALFLKKLQKYKYTQIGIWISFLGAGLFFITALLQYYAFFSPQQGVLLSISNAYEEPSLDSFKVLELPSGTELSIVDKVDNFYLIKTLEGKEYWILQKKVPILFEDNIPKSADNTL